MVFSPEVSLKGVKMLKNSIEIKLKNSGLLFAHSKTVWFYKWQKIY